MSVTKCLVSTYLSSNLDKLFIPIRMLNLSPTYQVVHILSMKHFEATNHESPQDSNIKQVPVHLLTCQCIAIYEGVTSRAPS